MVICVAEEIMIVYVNWAKVHELYKYRPPDYVLQNLCSQNKEYLKGIFSIKQFERYFTDQKPVVPELAVIISVLRETNDIPFSLGKIEEECPIYYKSFEFVGEDNNFTTGMVPSWCDRSKYQFYKSNKKAGDGLLYENIHWIVVCNRIVKDPIIMTHIRNHFVIVPRAVFQLEPEYLSCFEYDETLVRAT